MEETEPEKDQTQKENEPPTETDPSAELYDLDRNLQRDFLVYPGHSLPNQQTDAEQVLDHIQRGSLEVAEDGSIIEGSELVGLANQPKKKKVNKACYSFPVMIFL